MAARKPKPEPTLFCTAAPPFNKAAADLVLRSSDNVDFHVRRAILAEASPVFEDMLSLPQPPSASSSSAAGSPVVALTEPARTLDALLRLCYPIADPPLASPEDVCNTLEAARKYLMDGPAHTLAAHFAAHAARDPLHLYALACARGWAPEMRVAARASLAHPLPDGRTLPSTPHLDTLSASAYLRLQAYHRACRRVAVALHCYGAPPGAAQRVYFARRARKDAGHLAPWCGEYVERAREALALRPCGATVLAPELAHAFLVEAGAKLPLHERTRMLFDLVHFNAEYAQSVDRAVDEVQLEVYIP
ncbi:hypothetical protein PsYK624_074390 [Phanerochaete sordida]|uniref:BTB domain-containing protein n=1 Tax=Phanerochaete sordida TaxID=48140 RepID=A0A9P3GCD3_9APHY|nr:hypothetical protein PsYK624_074390 [Phanerochaete sordida]